jgi:hypothetical protein
MRGFALRKPKTWAMCFESAAQIGNGPKSPGRAGGGPSSLGFQAGIEATHRPLSNASGRRPGLSAGGPNRFSRRLESGVFGAGDRTGTRFGNQRHPGFRHPTAGRIAPGSPRPAEYRGAWLGTVRGPSGAANAPRSTARLRIRASGRSATHSGLTGRSTGTRRRVLRFQPRGAAGPVNLNVRLNLSSKPETGHEKQYGQTRNHQPLFR